MSATKRLWEDAVEQIYDDYAASKITRDEAISKLHGKGFDRIDAENNLDAIDEGRVHPVHRHGRAPMKQAAE